MAEGPFGANDFATKAFQPEIREVMEKHCISTVWDAHCDYSAEVACECDWKGSPDWYTEHLLFMLGLTSTMTQDWLNKFVGVGNAREYADLFDQPSNVNARKAVEAKARKVERDAAKLRRMAANGDREAQAALEAQE